MLFSLLLCLFQTAEAVPIQLTQQGRIVDQTGASVIGTHDLTFRLYINETSNTPVWSETLVTSFSNGYYAAILGTNETTNPLDSDVLSLYPLYLELQLDSNTPMSPRQEITSAPYAQISGVAESVEGGIVDASEIQIGSIPVIDGNRNWVGEPITIDWSQIQNIPIYVSDGDDNTQLSESEIEQYVTNDGISLHADTTLNGQEILTLGMDADSLADISCTGPDVLKWDINLNQWYCALDMDTLGDLNCNAGYVPSWNGSAWVCDENLDSLQVLNCSDQQVPMFDQSQGGWICGTSTDSLGELNCQTNQIASFNGTNWECRDGNSLFDSDGDGTPVWDDCDDGDANSTSKSLDLDCDGLLAADDCDNADPNSTIVAQDGDCDGVLTNDDCDDGDADSTLKANDVDCDGVTTDIDCDDNNVDLPSLDFDCDGVLTENDCDDDDASNTNNNIQDADCDGSLTSDDCDDDDPLRSPDFEEDCTDGIDNDCDNQIDYSADCFGGSGTYDDPYALSQKPTNCQDYRTNGANMDGFYHMNNGVRYCELSVTEPSCISSEWGEVCVVSSSGMSSFTFGCPGWHSCPAGSHVAMNMDFQQSNCASYENMTSGLGSYTHDVFYFDETSGMACSSGPNNWGSCNTNGCNSNSYGGMVSSSYFRGGDKRGGVRDTGMSGNGGCSRGNVCVRDW